MAFPFDYNDAAFPGIETVLETVQNQVWWGRHERQVFAPAVISGTARDAGNSVVTTLRGGLLLGRITSSGLLKEWVPTATDGSQTVYGVLISPLNATDGAGADTNRYTFVMVNGDLMDDRVLVPTNAEEGLVGDALEFQVRAQAYPRFNFDRSIIRVGNTFDSRVVIKAADYTILATDNGTMFVDTGAAGDVTYDLPAALPGMRFAAAAIVATHDVIFDAGPASGTIITPGDVAATTWTCVPGTTMEVVCINADEWLLTNFTTVA